MDAFDDRHESAEELERDGHSMLVRALDREEGIPVLVRRVVRSRRFDVDVRAGLVAEAEYCARLACSRCPEAEAFTLEDGELILEYKGADGVELDRVFSALAASGRVLTPAAAVALVSEVLHNAEAIARIKPPAVEVEVWGHGEISPRAVMLGRDGFGRLYEVRLATTGFRSLLAPGSALCRAPELVGGVLFGTPASDVYAVGALVSLALFGASALAAASAEPLGQVVQRVADNAPGTVPDAVLEVLRVALDVSPASRYSGPEALREALRTAMPLDLAGWRATAEGLAALARTLAGDRKLEQVPEALFVAHPGLARISGARGADIDDDLAAFAQDQVLTSSQAVAAMSPLGDGRMTPKRGTALPRRIAVVPRRVSRAVHDAFDIPRASPVPGATGDIVRASADLGRSSDLVRTPPGGSSQGSGSGDLVVRTTGEFLRSEAVARVTGEVRADLPRATGDLVRTGDGLRSELPQPSGDLLPRFAVPRGTSSSDLARVHATGDIVRGTPLHSPIPLDPRMSAPPSSLTPIGGVAVMPADLARDGVRGGFTPGPLAPLDPRLPPSETSDTVMVDEREAARSLARPAPMLEIVASDPRLPRPQLEVVPSDPAPPRRGTLDLPPPPHPHHQADEAGGAQTMWLFVAGVLIALGGLVALTLLSGR